MVASTLVIVIGGSRARPQFVCSPVPRFGVRWGAVVGRALDETARFADKRSLPRSYVSSSCEWKACSKGRAPLRLKAALFFHSGAGPFS